MVKKDELLIPLLSRILNVPQEQLHDDNDLIYYGLDSMCTMRIATHLRRAGIDITFSTLIEKRTLKEWRQAISAAVATKTPSLPDQAFTPEAPFPLATMQHAFWIGRNEQQRLGGVSAHFYAELEGEALEPPRLAAAWQKLVQRHPMLRLRIGADIRQHVMQESPCQLQIHNFRRLSSEQCEARLASLRQRYTHQQLDIANGETMMVALSLLPGGRSRLHLDLDMIAGDAASLRILLTELAQFYKYPSRELSPLTYTFAQYQYQQRAREEKQQRQDRRWWRDRLAELAPPPALPLHPNETSVPLTECRHFWLNETQKRTLSALCQQAGLTLPAVLATVFAETIGLWSGGERFVLNLPVFSRAQDNPQVEQLVGDFSSSVLINVDPGQQPDFIAQANELQQRLHQALAHATWSGVDVLRECSRLQQGQPMLAPVVFTSALALGEIYTSHVRQSLGEPIWSISQGPQVWLDAQATEYHNGILLNWDVRVDLFAPGAIDAMFNWFQQQVAFLLESATHWCRPLAVMPPAVSWPLESVATKVSGGPLHARFFAQAQKTPDAVALRWGDASVMHYGDLAQRALRVAHCVQQQGIGVGDTVAISMGKGPQQVIAVLGVLAAGATYVPCGIDIPRVRREQVCRRANVSLILCDSREQYQPEWPSQISVLSVDVALHHSPLAKPVAVDPHQPVYVIFTSGSTGEPKGVDVSHYAVANTVDAVDQQAAITPQDCTLSLSALDFDLSAYDIFAFLSRGASVVVVDESERRDAHAWITLLQRWPVSVISCVPALLEMILTAADAPLPTLRLVMLGGDRIPVSLASRWWRMTRGATFIGLGGMTEAAIHSTLFVLHADDPRWTSVPYGKPLPNMHCRVVDTLGRDCPAWVAGELWVSGPSLALGYRGEAERSADKFVQYAGRRWYRSGDRVRYWPDGVIEHIGRNDHQIKIRGHRIEPGEIEAALMRHPAILRACVTSVASVTRQLCAVLEVTEDVGSDVWRHWLQRSLPPYAIPEHYRVVANMPLTANGKIDRQQLQHQAEQHCHVQHAPSTPPVGEIEQQVAALWCELLNLPAVSREDSFFVLGGDSLIATRLIAALRQCQLSAPLHALFSTPTLAQFSQHVVPTQGASVVMITANPEERYQPFVLSDIQRAFWIGRAEHMTLGGVGSHFYMEFDGEGLDIPRLEWAWQQLIDRHDMLRAVVTEDGLQQVLIGTEPYRFRQHDAQEDSNSVLQLWRDRLSHRVYDVQQWPLFDIQVVHYRSAGQTRQRLMVSLDSIMLDGRSIMILFTEWDHGYRSPATPLPPLDIQYRDYITQQPRPSADDEQRAKSYWQQRLQTLPDMPALPLAVTPGSITQPRFQRWRYALSAVSWQRFTTQAQRYGITPSVALAAAYGEVLSYWSNQSALALNLTLFDRQPLHPHIDRVVGDFASILLLDYQATQGKGFYQAALRLQQQEGEGLSQSAFSGIQVLRELARYKAQSMVAVPVVFTSVLGLDKDASLDLSPAFPTVTYAITQTPQVWLDAKVSESQGCLLLEWDALDALFPTRLIENLFAAYCWLVESLVNADWQQPVALALPPEQQRLRAQINHSTQDFASSSALYLRFFAQAERTPQAMALVWGEGESLDYATLAQQALCVAGCLRQQGMQPGDRVAITHVKGVHQIIAVLGVLAAGGCYVPCAIDLPTARREHVYHTANVHWVLTDNDSLAQLAWSASVVVATVSDALLAAPLPQPVQQSSDAPMYIIFTSGSTGDPKGVVVSHGAVANTLDAVAQRFSLNATDRSITLSALDFDLSAYDIFAFLSIGGSLVVITESQRRDAAAWVVQMHRWQVSVVSAVPALVDMITSAAQQPGLPASLRLVMVGGDRVLPALPQGIWALSPQTRFAALGGMTEVAIHATCHDITPDDLDWICAPFGVPLANMRCRVVDYLERDCPDGVKGELWISGAGLAQGYVGDEQRTAEKFVTWQGNTWYRTGDVVAYRSDGVLAYWGREDGQVKIRGHRIELAAVEGTLSRLPQVVSAAALVLEGASRQLAAAVVCAADADMAQIKTAMQASLADYEVPEHLIAVSALPLTANGKIDREAIRSHCMAYLSQQRDSPGEQSQLNPAEQRVAGLWQALLGVTAVSATDNFFSLGGDSLIATRLMSRLPQVGYRGTLACLFRQPVLRAFAATLIAVAPEQNRVLCHDTQQRYLPFPLTDVQQAYWLGRREGFILGGIGAQCYHEYELPGLDKLRMEQAWNRLVTRHDMLRCVIGDDGQQTVLKDVPYYYFRYHDVRQLVDATAHLMLLRERMACQTLTPDAGRLYDVQVIDYGPGQTRLAVLFDNLIVDGLSMLTLFSELFQCYQQPECPLPSLSVTFRDYLCWREQQGRSAQAAAYWQQRLERLPPAPALPTRIDPATITTPQFRRLQMTLDSACWRQLTDRARQVQVTPSVLLLTCFAETLSRWSGQSSLVVTMTQFDRQPVHPDINQVVGDFTSLILAEYQADPDTSWLTHAQRLQEQVWRDLDNQAESAVAVLRQLAQQHGGETHPAPVVFTSMLGVADAVAKAARWPDFTRSQTPQVWLDHQVIDLADGLLLSWDYVDALFPTDMVEQMFDGYCQLLCGLVHADWQSPPVRQLPQAQRRVREKVNTTAGSLPLYRALHEAFFHQALQTPQRFALWDPARQHVSYGELRQQALAVAAGLQQQGIGAGDCVALCVKRGCDQIAALLGILAIGAAYLPINPTHPGARQTLMCCKAHAKGVISDESVAMGPPVFALQTLYAVAPLAAPVIPTADTPAYVLFTSGSTGEPKGVVVEHRNALNTLEDICHRYAVQADDVFLGVAALDFDLSVFDVFGALSQGALLVLTQDTQQRDAQAWLWLMQRMRVTVWNSVPALLEMVLDMAYAHDAIVPDLRLALLSGDWVNPALGERLRKIAPQVQMIALGGATEAAIWSTAWPVSSSLTADWRSVPYGLPLRNQYFRVVDALGQDAPDWVPGELWIGGQGVARGYCADPELTQRAFSGDYPTRWYRTGDRGRYRPDGVLEFLGRCDEQIKLRGHRIELGEIEQVLEGHVDIQRAVVVVHGVGDQARLLAFVEPAGACDDPSAFLATLDTLLHTHLPNYAIPAAIRVQTTWPLTRNGKIDRTLLKTQTSLPLPSTAPLDDPLAHDIATLWQQVVGGAVPGTDDSFFAVGGNSLLATRLLAQLCQHFSIRLTLREFFADATVSGLGAAVARHLATHTSMEEGLL